MNAWQVSEWCEPEQMKLADVPVPEPESGEVRIRNHAAALNFFDILQIQGKYQTKPPLPFTPGAEVAGVVEAVGPDVDHLSVGDRVMGSGALGGFAEYTVTPAAKTFRIPATMDFAEAAGMLIVYQTSYLALKVRAAIKAQVVGPCGSRWCRQLGDATWQSLRCARHRHRRQRRQSKFLFDPGR